MEDREKLRIFEVIKAFSDYVDGFKKGRTSVIKIDVNELDQFIHELMVCIPDDIRSAKALLQDADSILTTSRSNADMITAQAREFEKNSQARAEAKAKAIIKEATAERESLISRDSITQEAQRRADAMLEAEKTKCDDLYSSAKKEAAILLHEAEIAMRLCVKTLRTEYDRIGARDWGTRYEPAYSEEEYEAQPDDESEERYDRREEPSEDYDDEQEDGRTARRTPKAAPQSPKEKGSGIIKGIFDTLTGFYTSSRTDDEDETSYDDGETSFDNDEGVDD